MGFDVYDKFRNMYKGRLSTGNKNKHERLKYFGYNGWDFEVFAPVPCLGISPTPRECRW